MATRTKAGSKPDGAAWAATQRQFHPGCHTCAWGRSKRDGLRFIDAALGEMRGGRSSFAFPALVREARLLFGYPYGKDAVRKHYAGCAK